MKPIAMKCSKEQFEEIRPLLIKDDRFKVKFIDSFKTHEYLINNYAELLGTITNMKLGRLGNKRDIFHTWDKDTFLKYCDILPSPTFKVGDMVTYKSKEKCGGSYKFGGRDLEGETGKILVVGEYLPDCGCYSVVLTAPFSESEVYTYAMLESEFVEYDNKNKYIPKCEVLPLFTIEEITNPKSNIIVYIDFQEDWEKLKEVVGLKNITTHYYGPYCYSFSEGTYSSTSSNISPGEYSEKSIIITIDQIIFDSSNKTIKKMRKNNCTAKELIKIVDIACDSWKSKLYGYLQRVDDTGNIHFTEYEVMEMFEAATSKQKSVLDNIFPETPNIDFSKIKSGSVVKIKYTGNHVHGSEYVNFSKPVDVVLFKTRGFIRNNGYLPKNRHHDSYCTFYQNGKYIVFTSDDVIDYITDVIEY